MSYGSSISRARFSIASLMVLVAISALIALGIRHFGAAITEGLPESYGGDGMSQDIMVLREVILALAFISLAGTGVGIAVKRSSSTRIITGLKLVKPLVSLVCWPMLLLAFLQVPTIAKQLACGSVFFVQFTFLFACWNSDPLPDEEKRYGNLQQPEIRL
jgi:hypothetical protein